MRLLIAFLILDGLGKLASIVYAWVSHSGLSKDGLVQETYYKIILVVFYFLLAIQLGLRTSAGRLWTLICFSFQVAIQVSRFTLARPELWAQIGTIDRLQVLGNAAVLLAFSAYLCTPSAREAVS